MKQGDRFKSPGGDMVTVIKPTGPRTAVVRFDGDAAFNKKHGLAPSSGDMEFNMGKFTKVDGK
jgi:hypothetical protein